MRALVAEGRAFAGNPRQPTRIGRRLQARRFGGESALIAGFDVAAVAALAVARQQFSIGVLLCAVAVLLTGALNGSYRKPRLATSTLLELKDIVQTSSLSLVVCVVAYNVGLAQPDTVRYAGWVIPVVVVGRVLCFGTLRSLRHSGRLVEPTILIGSGRIAGAIEEAFADDLRKGVRIIATIDPAEEFGTIDEAGPMRSLDDLVCDTNATRVIVAYGRLPDWQLVPWLRTLRSNPVEVLVVPRLYDFGSSAGDVRSQSCNGVPLVWLPHREWRREQVAAKRALDLLLCLVGIVVVLPVLLCAALAVRVSSPGPIIFRQVRVGRDGRLFTMYKFRTMRVAGDEQEPATEADRSRVTLVGSVLRRVSIDELPQFVNVLKGDMSIVGPRPELPHIVERCQAIPGYAERHRVPVGITGWAQVNGLRGPLTSLEDRVAHDNYYIDHWSLWFDAVIVLRTLHAAVKGR